MDTTRTDTIVHPTAGLLAGTPSSPAPGAASAPRRPGCSPPRAPGCRSPPGPRSS
ncbi:hypothetical protein V2I01_26460 [Micromonospora sp. BRA006-A]|nr:hypothetical protein [Micromonospora sp. BRA006-A]